MFLILDREEYLVIQVNNINYSIGTDGSTPTTRIAKYWTTSSLGENLAASNYNSTDGTRVIIQLIVDDGVPDRGHRANLYSSIYTHSGVSCGWDIKYEVQWCLDYAKNPVSLSNLTFSSLQNYIVL